MVWHTALGTWQSHLIPPPSLHGGGSSLLGLVPPDDAVNLRWAVNLVIGYQVDEFTGIWYAEQFLLIPTFILGSQVMCHH